MGRWFGKDERSKNKKGEGSIVAKQDNTFIRKLFVKVVCSSNIGALTRLRLKVLSCFARYSLVYIVLLLILQMKVFFCRINFWVLVTASGRHRHHGHLRRIQNVHRIRRYNRLLGSHHNYYGPMYLKYMQSVYVM